MAEVEKVRDVAAAIASSRKPCDGCGVEHYDWDLERDFRWKGDPLLCPKCRAGGPADGPETARSQRSVFQFELRMRVGDE